MGSLIIVNKTEQTPFRIIFETVAGGIVTNKALKLTGKPKLTERSEGISDGVPEVLKSLFV